MTAVLIVTLLIIVNGLFVAAEFAIITIPRTTLARLARDGNSVAAAILEILDDPILRDRFVTTAQLGVTLASLGLGMYGEHILAHWFEVRLEHWDLPEWLVVSAISSVLAVTILTYLHIVLGEMVPKSMALQYSERTALVIARPIIIFERLFYPLVVALNGMSNIFLRMVGIETASIGASRGHTIDELQLIVRESLEAGALPETGEFLDELIEFSELTAGEVMVPRVKVVGIELDSAPEALRSVLHEDPHTRYLVYSDNLDHVVGVVHTKDILKALLRGDRLTRQYVRETRFIPETSGLDQTMKTMVAARTQMLVVMDEHGGTAGLVTLEDLIEEIVGQIEETATRRLPITRDRYGNLLVTGTVRLEELGEELGMELEHDEIDSVSGIVLATLGRPPRVGDRVEYEGVRITVTRVRMRGVEEARITPIKVEG